MHIRRLLRVRWAIAAVVAALVGMGAYLYLYSEPPTLRGVTCRWVSNGGITVAGEIFNPSPLSRTFAVRPTFWLGGAGQIAKDMHIYVSVPPRATRHWSESYSIGTKLQGSRITKCAPYAYGADRPSGD